MATEAEYQILLGNLARAAGKEPKPKNPGAYLEIRYKSKTEASYAAYLEILQRAGTIKAWWYEPVTLKLGFDTRYTADFLVQYYDGSDAGSLELHECKGRKGMTFYSRPLGKVKVRIAAGLFPMFRFFMVWPADHGEWNKERVRSE